MCHCEVCLFFRRASSNPTEIRYIVRSRETALQISNYVLKVTSSNCGKLLIACTHQLHNGNTVQGRGNDLGYGKSSAG
jgi:hypothetical protein